MHLITRTLFALAAVLASALASADAFDLKYAKMELLQLKPIQKEVGLTEAQRAKMNQFADQHRAKLEAMRKKVGGRAPNKAEQEQLQKDYVVLRDQVLGQLSQKQQKRLREITFQLADVSPLMDPGVAKRVGMSDAQVKKVRAAFEVGAKQVEALRKKTLDPILAPYQKVKPKDQKDAERLQREIAAKAAAAGKKIAPQMTQLQTMTRANMLAVLTPAQKKAWAALQGPRFDTSKLKNPS